MGRGPIKGGGGWYFVLSFVIVPKLVWRKLSWPYDIGETNGSSGHQVIRRIVRRPSACIVEITEALASFFGRQQALLRVMCHCFIILLNFKVFTLFWQVVFNFDKPLNESHSLLFGIEVMDA